MLSLFNKDIVQKALFYASLKHKGQFICKPPKEVPYATHFFGVVLNALNFTINEQVDTTFLLTLALLHDTIEDTDATYEELETEFGKNVADGVMALSRNPDLPYELQIEDCVKRIKLQPKEVAIIKMADRMFNIRKRYDAWERKKQDSYKLEAQMICDELGYASPNLKQALQLAIDNY